VTTIRLTPTRARDAQVDALAARHGGRAGLATVVNDLALVGRRTWAPGRSVRWAMTWAASDRRDRRWWPQGISSSADAGLLPGEERTGDRVLGRRLLMTSWYAKTGDGCRLSVIDRDLRRYQHLLVVRLTADGEPEPLLAHAGGICWIGPWVFVAATRRGFHVAHLDDVVKVGPRERWRGHDYLLPVRFSYAPAYDDGDEPLRFSFLSLDRAGKGEGPGPRLLVGEYGRGRQTTRMAHFGLDPDTGLLTLDRDGVARPLWHDGRAPLGAQGAVVARGRFHVSVSHGPYGLGSLYAGEPGTWRRRRWALPIGPEDLCYWPSENLLWSVTEHPRRRWIVAVRPPR